MQNSDSNQLDPIAFHVLLLFSGGHRLTVYELSESSKYSVDKVWDALKNTLLKKNYVKRLPKGKFVIDVLGIEHLLKNGISAEMEEESFDPDEFIKKLPFSFKNRREALIWFLPLMLLALLAAALTLYIHYRLLPPVELLFQILAWLAALALAFFYVKYSYRHLMSEERIVLFSNGKPYHEKGPGHVLFFHPFYRVKEVDMREQVTDIIDRKCATRDNLTLLASLHVVWEIIDATLYLTKKANVPDSIAREAEVLLCISVSEYTLDDAQRNREIIEKMAETRITRRVAEWGVQINQIVLNKLDPPDLIKEGLANRRKAILESEAYEIMESKRQELLRNLLTLSEIMARSPSATLLKYLDTLEKISVGNSTKFVIPMEFVNFLKDIAKKIPSDNDDSDNNSDSGDSKTPPTIPPPGLNS
ncbi:MAG: hypothetical protein LC099_03015 [Anaerolineales bacterium]|nr:hypothetical protein [Anaerolineales bacterium]